MIMWGCAKKCGGSITPTPSDASLIVLWHQQQPAYTTALAAGLAAVSPLWVYASLRAGKLLPPGDKLCQPLPGPGLPAVLAHPASYVGCISGFAGWERWEALALMACLGMRVTKSLTPLGDGRNTHLVACTAEEKSRKLEAARASNMHIVSIRWPMDCLMRWTLLPEGSYTEDVESNSRATCGSSTASGCDSSGHHEPTTD